MFYHFFHDIFYEKYISWKTIEKMMSDSNSLRTRFLTNNVKAGKPWKKMMSENDLLRECESW